MAKKLELWYFAKPFITTQAWGIYNPAYEQFGFDHHNGQDVLLESDSLFHAPCDMQLISKEWQPTGGGNLVRYKTLERVIAEGTECWVVLVFMHLKVPPAYDIGTVLRVGDVVGVADNTGFSTGPHTHMTVYREDDAGNRLDADPHYNHTFDPKPYWNGYYAVDKVKVLSTLSQIFTLLTNFLNGVKKQG